MSETERHAGSDEAHDILAAEEFGIGAADRVLHDARAHDVLAAEEFAIGVGDAARRHEPAHDVLAAEEFPVPAGAPHPVPPGVPPGAAATPARAGWRLRAAVTGGSLALLVLSRRRRRGR